MNCAQASELSVPTTPATEAINAEIDKQSPQELFEVMKGMQVCAICAPKFPLIVS